LNLIILIIYNYTWFLYFL